MPKTSPEVTFKPPYGGAESHVPSRRKNHGYHWIVAHGVHLTSIAQYIETQCALAHADEAPFDAVFKNHDGIWVTITDFENQDYIDKLRPYVLALEKYERELKEQAERRSTLDLTPAPHKKFPLRMVALACGMPEITSENWGEFYVRVRLSELREGGAFLKDSDTGKPVPITPQMARDHVGLVLRSDEEERAAWTARIFRGAASEAEYEVKRFDPSYSGFPEATDEDTEDNEYA